MKKFLFFLQLIQNMGLRYFAFRSWFEMSKKTGILKRKFPQTVETREFVDLESWRSNSINPFQFSSIAAPSSNTELFEKVQRIINGQIQFFNNEWIDLGKNYNWTTNPSNQYQYDAHTHWTEINDFSKESGDIKFVWEKSRFSYLYSIVRNDFHNNMDHSEFVFQEIENWIDSNPINSGPNWKCSQEISIRIINWTFALHYYKDSNALTEKRFQKIQHVIFWSLHHVHGNIDFSRIAVRNNHAITETLFLALSNILYPYIPETKIWSKKGRAWFEKEIEYQIYEDGTFLQFSMNYHRVAIQLLSIAFIVSEKAGQPFSKIVYSRAYKSIHFLYQCLQHKNGHLPNYGSNDGALFFPMNDAEYRDYRPQINHLHKIVTGEFLFDTKESIEDFQWMNNQKPHFKFEKLVQNAGLSSFNKGGYYLIRENNTFTFIRCGNHKDRPAHADNLHMDVWIDGENILRDSGTYKYNTTPEYTSYFTGTQSHNTCAIKGHQQMLKGSRFIWYFWTQAKKAELKEHQDYFQFEGSISAFRNIHPKIEHQRIVRKWKGEKKWTIHDSFIHANGHVKEQYWHSQSPLNSAIRATEQSTDLPTFSINSHFSSHYGSIEKGHGVAFQFNHQIDTEIQL